MRKIEQLPSLSNVSAGATATLNAPVGLTYDRIIFEYSGVTRAQMKDITVKINGKPIQEFADGDELDALNDYYGRSDTAGFLSLYFARPEMVDLGMQRSTGLGTADVKTLMVDIDIDGAALAPVIKAHAIKSDPQPLGSIVKVKRFQYNAGIVGQNEIDSIPTGPNVLAMHFKKADVTDVEVEVDSQKVTDASKTLLEAIQKEHGRTPQTAGYTHVDYGMEGDIFQALLTAHTDGNGNRVNVQDFRQRVTVGSTGALPVIVEYVDGFAGI